MLEPLEGATVTQRPGRGPDHGHKEPQQSPEHGCPPCHEEEIADSCWRERRSLRWSREGEHAQRENRWGRNAKAVSGVVEEVSDGHGHLPIASEC